jgi:hypothetical protein
MITCNPELMNFEKEFTDGQKALISIAKTKIIDALHSKIDDGNVVADKVNVEYPQLYSILRIAAIKPTVVDLPKLFKELDIIYKEEDFSVGNILNPYTKEGAGMIALNQYCVDVQLYTGGEDLILDYSFPSRYAKISKYKSQEEILEYEEKLRNVDRFVSKEKFPKMEEIIVDLYGVPNYKIVLQEAYRNNYMISGFYPELDEDNQVIFWMNDDYLSGENIEATNEGLIYCENYSDALKEYNSLIKSHNDKMYKTRIMDDKLVSIQGLNSLLRLKTTQEHLELEEEEKRRTKNSRRSRRANGEIKLDKSTTSHNDDYYDDEEE